MPRTEVDFVSFVSGEWSPKLGARVDLARAPHAAQTLQNMVVSNYGRAERRAGTRFVASVKVAGSPSPIPSPSPSPSASPSGSPSPSPLNILGSNPVLQPGPDQPWEETAVYEPSVIYEGGVFKMWYGGGWDNGAIGYATSSDGSVWTKYAGNPVIGQGGSSIAGFAARNNVLKVGATYYCYYADAAGAGANLRRASSSDGIAWTAEGVVLDDAVNANADGWAGSAVWVEGATWYMIVDGHTAGGLWELYALTSSDGLSWTFLNSGDPLDSLQVAVGGMYGGPCVPIPHQVGGVYHLWFHASPGAGVLPTDIYHATSADLVTWTVDATPVLERDEVNFELDQVADAWLVEAQGITYLFYAGMDNPAEFGTLGLAVYGGSLLDLVNFAGTFERITLEAERLPGSNPVAGWNLNEASGTRADAINDFDLTENGTIGTTAGPGSSTAAEMTGSEHLSRATEYAIQLGNFDFTFAGWINISDNNGFPVVLTKFATNQQQLYLYVEPTGFRFLLYPALTNTGQQELFATTFGVVPNNTWAFLLVSHDAVNDLMRIQVNNGTVDSVGYATGINPQSTAPLRLGGDGGSSSSTRRMGRWGFWRRLLSAAEITALYNAGNGVDF